MARKVNPLLAKIEEQHRIDSAIRRRYTIQQCCDMMLIAANAAFGFGPERLAKLNQTYEAVFHEFAEMAVADGKDDPDIEYTRAKLDAKLSQILGDKFEPWEKRYDC